MFSFRQMILVSGLALPLIVQAEEFIGYGNTQEEARSDLAQNILTSVNSEFLSETQVSKGVFSRYFSSQTQSSQQSTSVILTGVTLKKNTDNEGGINGGYIASINKEQFKRDAQDTITNVEKRCNHALPDNWDARNKELALCLNDTNAALGMAMVASPNKINGLKKLNTRLQNEASLVEISVASTPNTPFRINNQQQQGNATVRMPAGDYTLSWQHDEYCSAEQKVTIKAGERVKINQKLQRKPIITIKAVSTNTQITLDGKYYVSGTPTRFDCEGSVNYLASNGHQTKTAQIKLKPGQDRTITVNLLSSSQTKELSDKADSFTRLNQYNVMYAYSYADDYDAMHRIKLENIKSKGALRYGYGALFGKGSDSAREYETYLQAALQLTHLGSVPLHVANWVVIPYVGAEVGVGYHDRIHSKSDLKVHIYGDKEKFSQDYLSLKYLAGADLPINKNFSLKLQMSKNIRNAKDVEAAAGIAMQF